MAPLQFCRRKYRTLGLLCIVAVLFYLLQCISISQLGKIARPKSAHSSWDETNLVESKNMAVQDGFLRDGNTELVQVQGGERDVAEAEIEIKVKSASSENDKIQKEKMSDDLGGDGSPLKVKSELSHSQSVVVKGKLLYTYGVLPMDRKYYKPDGNGMFACITAQQIKISMDQINDDFCDCPDSSDEPGTSACPHSKFYCSVQVPGSPPQFLHSSKVNDGICDCCDGSDEWQGALVPEYMRIKDGEPLGAVYHAPCTNKCQEIIALRQREDQVRSEARRLQEKYLQQAREELSEQQRLDYGPNGIFYPLSKTCHTFGSPPYTYEVCPFKSASQISDHGPAVNLGGKRSVVGLEDGQHVLVMSGGDSTLCPPGRARTSKIFLLCGMQDQVISVTESELCLYTFKVSSPAAC